MGEKERRAQRPVQIKEMGEPFHVIADPDTVAEFVHYAIGSLVLHYNEREITLELSEEPDLVIGETRLLHTEISFHAGYIDPMQPHFTRALILTLLVDDTDLARRLATGVRGPFTSLEITPYSVGAGEAVSEQALDTTEL